MNTDKIYAEQIANDYAPKETSKVIALKKLDQKAKRPARIFGYTFGIIFVLILGVGMSLCLGAIGGETTASMIVGVLLGLIGIAGCSINYPIYKDILEKSKKKYGSDIIRLAKEITEEK